VVAVGSRTLEKAQAFIQETASESAKAYGSYEDVLADSAVHGVYIPLPTSMHLDWVKKAAAKGKHILLEKPIATVSRTPNSLMHLQIGQHALWPATMVSRTTVSSLLTFTISLG